MKSMPDPSEQSDVAHAPDVPWWKDRRIAYALGYRMMIFWTLGFVGLLGGCLVQRWMSDPKAGAATMIRVIEDSFLGCAGGGLALALGFGIPFGIVGLLSQRERMLELEQEIDARSSRHDEVQ